MPATLEKTRKSCKTNREPCPECSGVCGHCAVCGGMGAVLVTSKPVGDARGPCPECAGRGDRYCRTCDGIGEVPVTATVAKLVTPKPAKPAKRDVCQWLTRPKASADRPGCWTAKVAICGDVYELQHSYAEGEGEGEGGLLWEIFDFRKQFVGGPNHHRLTVGPDGEKCDCEWATYKPTEDGYKACRHVRALRALLAWLEAREAAEYAVEEANRRLNEMPADCELAEAA